MNKYQVLISNIHFLYTVKTSVHVKSTLSNGINTNTILGSLVYNEIHQIMMEDNYAT